MVNNKYISLVVENYKILVNNPREVYGHDDSLPYNADVVVYKDGNELSQFKAYNDGWGGDTSVCSADKNFQSVYDELDKVCKDNLFFEYPNMKLPIGLTDVVDCLAFAYIDLHIKGGMEKNQFINEINK